MEDATLAWLDSYKKCITYGKINLLETNRQELILEGPGTSDPDAFSAYIEDQFDLQENQDVCIDALFEKNDPDSQDFIDISRKTNRGIVASQTIGTTVNVNYEGLEFSEVTDTNSLASVLEKVEFTDRSNPSLVERPIGINLNVNESGEVVWSFRQQ